MDLEFDTNGRNILTISKQIDYLSMEITLLYTFDITLTNTAKIDLFLVLRGREVRCQDNHYAINDQGLAQAVPPLN